MGRLSWKLSSFFAYVNMEQPHIATKDDLGSIELIVKLPLVIGPKMQLSYVKTAKLGGNDLLLYQKITLYIST